MQLTFDMFTIGVETWGHKLVMSFPERYSAVHGRAKMASGRVFCGLVLSASCPFFFIAAY